MDGARTPLQLLKQFVCRKIEHFFHMYIVGCRVVFTLAYSRAVNDSLFIILFQIIYKLTGWIHNFYYIKQIYRNEKWFLIKIKSYETSKHFSNVTTQKLNDTRWQKWRKGPKFFLVPSCLERNLANDLLSLKMQTTQKPW